ncbi:MAG: MBL fold metallo-hydrolase [Ileibacterium sp.]|nr:MBL fold metallo-hydrolase [Ileibacterium sp.]
MKEWHKKGQELLDQIENTTLSEDEMAIWYLGQCGFLAKKGNHTILVDPVLTDLLDAQGQTKRLYPAPFDPARLKVDTVLCTHEHRDHMCVETLQKLMEKNPDVSIIVPKGTAASLCAKGVPSRNVLGLNEKEIARTHGMRIQTVQTAHPVHVKNDMEQDLNLAYYVDLSGVNFLHLGDTYLTEKLLSDLKELDGVDVLMSPINGQDFYRTARGCIGNLSGLETAVLAKELQASLTIPTHYDMMRGNTCSVLEFVESMASHYSQGKLALPALGERILVKKEKVIEED